MTIARYMLVIVISSTVVVGCSGKANARPASPTAHR